MTMKPTKSHHLPDDTDRGQIIIIFAVAFAAVIMMLALLFDGARGVVLRRQLQNASDAAAVAAANTFFALPVKGCSATTGPNPGAPQPQVLAAAKASVQANLPAYDVNTVNVTCVGVENNVQVSLQDTAPRFFGAIFGGGPLTAQTRSVATNGYGGLNAFSIVLLDPSGIDPITGENHYTWPNGWRGCPSFGINGGITAVFESAVYVDSACDTAHGAAFAPNGGSATVTFNGGYAMHITGEYDPGPLTITPAPLIHQPRKPDPLSALVPPPVTGPTVRATKLTINGSQTAAQCAAKGLLGGNPGCILRPGVYGGGIELKSSAEVYLLPGIYVLQDGGLSLGAQSKLFAIGLGHTSATTTTWETDCPVASCGVLIYKTTVTSSDPVSVTAGATFMVRSYNPDADTGTNATVVSPSTYDRTQLRHLLIWQDRSPVPSSTYLQPKIQLQGGGNVLMSGAVYAPSAPVDLHGTSGGSSGTDTVDLTIQFIVWDLSLSGNSSFHFKYSANEFPAALDYGLVE
jgi:hypothetical protein